MVATLGAIVRQEEDEGVVILASLLQLLDESPDAVVHAADHCGIDFHLALPQFLLLVRQILPERNFLVALGDGLFRQDNPQFALAGDTFLAEDIPTLRIPTLILRNLLGRSLERPMRSVESQVEEERTLVVALVDEFDGVVRDSIREVTPRFELRPLIILDERDLIAKVRGILRSIFPGIVIIARPIDETIRTVEATLGRPADTIVANVPFPAEEGAISRFAQHLAESQRFAIQETLIARLSEIDIEVTDARAVGILAGNQRGAGRGADRVVVKFAETDTLLGEAVEVRRLNLRAVDTQVGITHIVHEDEDDVRSFFRIRCLEERRASSRCGDKAQGEQMSL